jgi:lipid II isoglutaminyl synthase (glutamine-hydrolysing)
MRAAIAILVGRLTRFAIRLVRPGGGSSVPGAVAEKIDPNLLSRALQGCSMGVVAVSGSAGKSSTTKLLVDMLRAHGLKVFTNPSTANIRKGLVAAVLTQADFRGRLDADIAVLELDEGHGAALAAELSPRLSVLTNVLSDQLDRFVDPEIVIGKLAEIASHSGELVLNSDDPNLALLPGADSASRFGLAEQVEDKPRYALNFDSVPDIRPELLVTAVEGNQVTISYQGKDYALRMPSSGTHMAMNLAGAVLALSRLVSIDWQKVEKTLNEQPPVFARDEIARIGDRDVRLMLVQNPTSFQLNVDAIAGTERPLMLMAGRDIHDPSWLWGVDFSKISHVDVVGGFNAADLALCLKYQGVSFDHVETDATKAADHFLTLEGPNPTILFSADAMRRTRRHLGLAK